MSGNGQGAFPATAKPVGMKAPLAVVCGVLLGTALSLSLFRSVADPPPLPSPPPPVPSPTRPSVLSRSYDDQGGVVQLTGGSFLVDRGFESMAGPSSRVASFKLSEQAQDQDKILWVKSIEAFATASGGEVAAEEFICHQNLALVDPPDRVNQTFTPPHHLNQRLLTLVEGRLSIDLPPGFAIPVPASAPLAWDSMTHHLNHQPGEKPSLSEIFLRIRWLGQDTENGLPLRPLFRRHFYLADPKAVRAKTGISLPSDDELCGVSAISPENPIHFRVPPGEHLYEMDLDGQWNVPFDTTAHYISAHLHTGHEWIRLYDLDQDRVVVELKGHSYPGRRGLQHIADLSSTQGIPVRKDGRYRLQAKYKNPSSEDIDGMAILYLHLLDEEPASSAIKKEPGS